MERNGCRFHWKSLIVPIVLFLVIPYLALQNKSESRMVNAFVMPKRTLRQPGYNQVGGEIRPRFPSSGISLVDDVDWIGSRNMANRNRRLMSHSVGIVGGGLAGLSTAYHLLKKSPSTDITIIDRQSPGTGGASSVAGGLLHPLSPKGKLAYKGIEGLASANEMVQAASQFEDSVVLRNKIYRIAMTEAQVERFQLTAEEFPEFATWMESGSSTNGTGDCRDDWEEDYFKNEKDTLGALRLSGDCKVLHMHSYLSGLWSYCESVGSGTKNWIGCEDVDSIDSNEWEKRLADYDCVVFAAGSGLFQSSLMDQSDFPITLVRGQSIEMKMDEDQIPWNAILCGKYVAPLLESGRVVVGATHEFKEEAYTPAEVEAELRERSYHFASGPWDNGTVEEVTIGYRVQSNRGPKGRLPIIGKLDTSHHQNSWVFTGLSGRGILYHGIYGDILSNLILNKPIEGSSQEIIDWWRM